MTSDKAPKQGEGRAALPGRVGGLLGLDLGVFDLGNQGIDTRLGVGFRQAGPRGNQLRQIGLVVG